MTYILDMMLMQKQGLLQSMHNQIAVNEKMKRDLGEMNAKLKQRDDLIAQLALMIKQQRGVASTGGSKEQEQQPQQQQPQQAAYLNLASQQQMSFPSPVAQAQPFSVAANVPSTQLNPNATAWQPGQ
eukprot:TRINITY_DN2691_c0_g1_i3.p2 TRINITY_DN2691_c0_g1~~TRINITY_DN2691_c0_g1_i3.p2  ORF type:complete len:127 (+),score=41.17 TRINITY_DN2691_c0_g1_i3:305-685(+)